jgi:hypothetical protein
MGQYGNALGGVGDRALVDHQGRGAHLMRVERQGVRLHQYWQASMH